METTNSSKKYRNVANKMIELFKQDNQPLSHKKLQKLVYLTYGFYYYAFQNRLFEEKFEAWPHGPVCRELYFDIKANKDSYNAFDITDVKLAETEQTKENSEKLNDICGYVKKHFGDWPANALEQLTHRGGSAWNKAVNKENEEELCLEDSNIMDEINNIIDMLR